MLVLQIFKSTNLIIFRDHKIDKSDGASFISNPSVTFMCVSMWGHILSEHDLKENIYQ